MRRWAARILSLYLPGALAERGEELATAIACLVHAWRRPVLHEARDRVRAGLAQQCLRGAAAKLRRRVGRAFSLLTSGIASAYEKAQAQRGQLRKRRQAHRRERGFSAQTVLLETTGSEFLADPASAEEVFGPTTLLVNCERRGRDVAGCAWAGRDISRRRFSALSKTFEEHRELLRMLETKVGRVIFNGFPTGVEVCHAMVHGGPYPATADGQIDLCGEPGDLPLRATGGLPRDCRSRLLAAGVAG
jgi:alpha-ketoglutaric semialdehyde dehydrogenase